MLHSLHKGQRVRVTERPTLRGTVDHVFDDARAGQIAFDHMTGTALYLAVELDAGPAEKYEELMAKLEVDRQASELSEEEEADRTAELDTHWRAMTTLEQERAEAIFSHTPAPRDQAT